MVEQQLTIKKRKSRSIRLSEAEVVEHGVSINTTEPRREVPEFEILVRELSFPNASKPKVEHKDLVAEYRPEAGKSVDIVKMVPPYTSTSGKNRTEFVKVKGLSSQLDDLSKLVSNSIVIKRIEPVVSNSEMKPCAKVLSARTPIELMKLEDVRNEVREAAKTMIVRVEKEEKARAEEKVQTQKVGIASSVESKTSMRGEVVELIPLEPLFIGLDKLVRLGTSRPKVVIALKPRDERYSYISFLTIVFRDIYRIAHGGLPICRFISSREELEELWPLLKASDSIVIIDYESLKISDGDEGNHARTIIIDRLRELSSQNLGFIVFYVSRGNVDKVRKLVHGVYGDGNPDVVEIELNEGLDIQEHLRALAKYVGLEEVPPIFSIDVLARFAEAKYFEALEDVLRDPRVLMVLKPNPVPDERDRESYHHLLLKALAIKELLDSYGHSLDELVCEQQLGDMVIDVCVRSGGRCSIAVEIETLYGTAIPLMKLREVIESRCSSVGVDELWIVIPRYALALYGRSIVQFMDSCIKEMSRRHSSTCRKIVLMSVGIEFDKEVLRPRLRFLRVFSLS